MGLKLQSALHGYFALGSHPVALWLLGLYTQRGWTAQFGHGCSAQLDRRHQEDRVLCKVHVLDRGGAVAEHKPETLCVPSGDQAALQHKLHLQHVHDGVSNEES